MKVNTNTVLIGLLGLAVVGGGTYLLLRDRKRATGATGASAGADEVATALNVKSAQWGDVVGMFEEALADIRGGTDPDLAQQNLIGGYLDMGLGGAAQIADIVSKFLPKDGSTSGGALQPGDPGTYFDPGLGTFVNAETGRPL